MPTGVSGLELDAIGQSRVTSSTTYPSPTAYIPLLCPSDALERQAWLARLESGQEAIPFPFENVVAAIGDFAGAVVTSLTLVGPNHSDFGGGENVAVSAESWEEQSQHLIGDCRSNANHLVRDDL